MSYKVVIADDEKRILDIMVKIIPWDELHLELVGQAVNGIELSNIIDETSPDIVMTDIKMPDKSGIDVIKEKSESHRGIRYIIVSGYNEFEFAKTAMKYGVKEYLLKPVDKSTIINALKNCAKEIDEEKANHQLRSMIDKNVDIMLPQMRKQFFRDIIMGIHLREENIKAFCQMFDIEDERFRLVVCILKDKMKADDINLLELGEIFLSRFKLAGSVYTGNSIVYVVADTQPEEQLGEAVNKFKDKCEEIYKKDVIVNVSKAIQITDFSEAYNDILDYVSNCNSADSEMLSGYYLDDECREMLDITVYDSVVSSIRYHNVENIEMQVEAFFSDAEDKSINLKMLSTMCIAWVLRVIVKCNLIVNHESVIRKLESTAEEENIDRAQLKENVLNIYVELSQNIYDDAMSRRDKIVNKVKEIVETEYADSELTVRRIGEKYLFLTSDYVSKMFKSATGMGINHYILQKRIEKAKELLKAGGFKTYEVADMCGFGNRAQYFTQVFKKMTGKAPKEYENESNSDE